MTVEYLAKAKSNIRAVADGSDVYRASAGDKRVPVDIYDKGGVKVFTAKITMNVKLAQSSTLNAGSRWRRLGCWGIRSDSPLALLSCRLEQIVGNILHKGIVLLLQPSPIGAVCR